MKFRGEKSNRGFSMLWFEDDYGVECSLQESSSIEPHIWLGVHNPTHKIRFKDSERLGLGLKKECEECNEYGWCDFPIPKEVSVFSRMHLNREQAKALGKKLLQYARKSKLK